MQEIERIGNQSSGLDIIRGKYLRGEIISAQGNVESGFRNFFIKNGYIEKTAASLISNKDSTVIFSGASISALKEELVTGKIPGNGFFVIQPCIRTRDFKNGFDNEVIPFGQTFFNMVCTLSRPGRYKDVCEEAIAYIEGTLGIEKSRIVIIPTSTNDDLVQPFQQSEVLRDVSVRFDSRKKYTWKYGIPNVSGIGLSINIVNPADGNLWDVGNIVSIRNFENVELGIEFGFGIEFMLSAALGVAEPIRMSVISQVEQYKEGLHQKYVTYLEAALQMMNAGAIIGDKKADHLYKQYWKSINLIRKSLGLNLNEVLNTSSKYSELREFPGWEEKLSSVANFLNKHEKRIEGLVYFANKINLGRDKFTNPEISLKKYALQNGIRNEEAFGVLNERFSHLAALFKNIK